jgi:hypothetical protein
MNKVKLVKIYPQDSKYEIEVKDVRDDVGSDGITISCIDHFDDPPSINALYFSNAESIEIANSILELLNIKK